MVVVYGCVRQGDRLQENESDLTPIDNRGGAVRMLFMLQDLKKLATELDALSTDMLAQLTARQAVSFRNHPPSSNCVCRGLSAGVLGR